MKWRPKRWYYITCSKYYDIPRLKDCDAHIYFYVDTHTTTYHWGWRSHTGILLMNLALYHLNKNAPTNNPTFVLNPACMGINPFSLSYSPAALSVFVRSIANWPNALIRWRTDDDFFSRFFGCDCFVVNCRDGSNSSSLIWFANNLGERPATTCCWYCCCEDP